MAGDRKQRNGADISNSDLSLLMKPVRLNLMENET